MTRPALAALLGGFLLAGCAARPPAPPPPRAPPPRPRPARAALLGGFLLAGCAARPPTGPTVLAIPPEGKDLARFQQEEANCRNYAFNQIGVGGPTTGADPAIGSAVGGTALGAAAG